MDEANRLRRHPRRRVAMMSGVVLGVVVLLVSGCGLFDDDKPVIRLFDGQWESLSVNNAIAAFIIEHGYGYPVESPVRPPAAALEELPAGTVDIIMEGWQQNVLDWYQEQLAQGTIVNLGPTFDTSAQFFVIPSWVAVERGIETVFDMSEHWELFTDPFDPSKGAFLNCVLGGVCHKINSAKLDAYGLSRHYNAISPVSYESLEANLALAQDERRPVFGYYWGPTSLIASYDWHVLREPEYTVGCWERLLAAVDGDGAPDAACAYEALPVDKLVHRGMLDKAPDVVEMLRRMNVGADELNDTLAWAAERDVSDWSRAAVFYLTNFEDRWQNWVTADAHRRIKEALAD